MKLDEDPPAEAADDLGGSVPDGGLSDLIGRGEVVERIPVRLSSEVIHLLSEQLYSSPLKAIEELVANAYDADAGECRVAIFPKAGSAKPAAAAAGPETPAGDAETPASMGGLIAVFDDGTGMTRDALKDLWSVGKSPKKGATEPVGKHLRMPIGKFGIGKLATYAVANRITYVTASSEGIHHVLCDFTRFAGDRGDGDAPVELEVREVADLAALLDELAFVEVASLLGASKEALLAAGATWTLCLLDHLKPKAAELQIGRLGWVLRTAMPLRLDFKVYLDGAEQVSSKETMPSAVAFKVGELDKTRIDAINLKYGIELARAGDDLVETTHFPSGIKGEAMVTWESLKGKSDRYSRSFGFFIRVRHRLVNLDDPLFHNAPLSFTTFNRFRADLDIDDLHDELTAPREGVGLGTRRNLAVAITHEVALQAREGYERKVREQADQKLTPEATRVYVAEHLVERPMADALTIHGQDAGGDVDATWMYVDQVPADTLQAVVGQLYEKRTRYAFKRSGLGETGRIARFHPGESSFTVNSDHELVKAFDDDPRSKELIDLVCAAEVMLEVYLVESDVAPFAIGEILTRRDLLLRSLATDRVYSRPTIAAMLRKGFDSAIGLELALIAAARALGFQVKHVAGSKAPDGIARFLDSSMKEMKLILEAKSSEKTPTLSALDFAGIHEHLITEGASGCLVVAPTYPGILDDGCSTANRANNLKLSCWTIEQLARVVERGEDLEITAAQIAEIVTSSFAPTDVSQAVEGLLGNGLDMTALHRGVMRTLKDLFARKSLPGTVKRVAAVAAILSQEEAFASITEDQVTRALNNLSNQSRGGMVMRKDVIIFHTDFEEVARRVSSLTGDLGDPRSLGTFKK